MHSSWQLDALVDWQSQMPSLHGPPARGLPSGAGFLISCGYGCGRLFSNDSLQGCSQTDAETMLLPKAFPLPNSAFVAGPNGQRPKETPTDVPWMCRGGLKIANEAALANSRVTFLTVLTPSPFLWLPLPGSNADLFAMTFFLGIVGVVVWNIYYSNPK